MKMKLKMRMRMEEIEMRLTAAAMRLVVACRFARRKKAGKQEGAGAVTWTPLLAY